MGNAEPTKFYVYDDVNIAFLCPACGYTKDIDVSKIKNKRINIKCKCGAIVKCSIEFRKRYRKKVNLIVQCLKLTDNIQFVATINDISANGARLACRRQPNLESGDILELEFKLKDNLQSDIRLQAEVAWVHDDGPLC